ncbi:MAG: PIG-L deacetylase family protein, partial [Planctomycetota bacterium]
MRRLSLPQLNSILCIGAHADDIEIGCGGTLLRLLEEQPGVEVFWLVVTGDQVREIEARESAEAFLSDREKLTFECWRQRDGFLPYDGAAVKEKFRELQERVSPDLVFTHRLEDRHQDHRFLSEMVWNSFRDQLILEYEIPKYEGDLGNPSTFVELSSTHAEKKKTLLMEHFASQRSKTWFTAENFEALMRIRGLE